MMRGEERGAVKRKGGTENKIKGKEGLFFPMFISSNVISFISPYCCMIKCSVARIIGGSE